MAEENKVVLHGNWCSPYSKRVELALKFKGIPYEYVEEDLTNKSDLLLKYNPIHKKVPVLVHNGKPIAESLVILEYIDETWKNQPRLLPDDPHERARIRFWTGYIEQLLESSGKLYISEGPVAEACKEMFERLDVLEVGMKDFFSGNPRSTNGESLDLLDVMIVTTLGVFSAQEEFWGIKILDREKHPLIFQWVTALLEWPVVKETVPPHGKLISLLQRLNPNAMKTPTN